MERKFRREEAQGNEKREEMIPEVCILDRIIGFLQLQ